MRATQAVTALVCLASIAFGQGSLTPPGAPAPTMKTLSQLNTAIAEVGTKVEAVEARIDLATVAAASGYQHWITESGSYYLSENLEVTTTSGIYIAAPDVTLDLNGFKIYRTSGSGGYGVRIASGSDRVTVKNGSVVGGFHYGIKSSSAGHLFEKLAVSGCTVQGLQSGSFARVIDCHARDNPGDGIATGYGSILSGCIASKNGSHFAIGAGSASVLNNCTVYDNQSASGFHLFSGSTMRGCSAHSNKGSAATTYGILAEKGSVIIECASYGNSNTSGQCVGIFVGLGSTIKDCTTKNNQGDGIRVDSGCRVTGNTCYSNGYNGDGAGIHATGTDNRIDGNNVTDNDRGIDVDVGGNFIVRNTASGNNKNWDVVANNACLVVYRTGCSAISGSSGGTSPGSTDPNANFTY